MEYRQAAPTAATLARRRRKIGSGYYGARSTQRSEETGATLFARLCYIVIPAQLEVQNFNRYADDHRYQQ